MVTPTRRARQKGAISVLAAVALGVSIAVAALALDLGHIFWVKRDLQKAADLASLSALTNLGNASTVAQQVALENKFDYQNAATANSLTVMTGVYTWNSYTFSPGGAAAGINAVRVTAGTTVPYFFLPGSQRVAATATAARDATAGFSLGSFIARLDSSNSPLLNAVLGKLLGGAVNLDLVSYKGLAAGSVTLAGLQAALGLGSVDEVLNADLTLAELLAASIAALNNKGDPASLNAASILGSLRATASSALSLRLGELLNVDSSNPGAAANAEVNLLQMLMLGAELANSGNLLNLPLGISIPGVSNINMTMALIGKPSIAIGPARRGSNGEWVTQAHAAQVRLKLDVTLLGSLLGGVVRLPIYIESGAATAALTGIQCSLPKDNSNVTIETQPQLLAAYIGEVDNAAMQNTSAPVTVKEATLVNVAGLIRVTGLASVPLQSPAQELVFNGPFDSNNTQTVAGASLGIGGLLNSNLQLTVHPLGANVSGLTSLLGGVLGPALDGLLDPLLTLLGVQLGGADVTAFELNCGAPRLVF